jgi:hypothetical protein
MRILWLLALLALTDLSAQEVKGLDREFYNAYLDSLPNEKKQRTAMVKKNLLAFLKKTIPREDPEAGTSFAAGLKEDAFQYEEVFQDTPYVRGMLREIPGFRTDKFMYIIKTGPYLIFAGFNVNPALYVTAESQRRLIRVAPSDGHSK